ncbi:molybdopterin-dependent oxidoreductase [Raoultibacter phocaeensis]|uniref:molybdopterin-dependent oxidoreductase n=1 Tax=Raoultibacter phocaeensis TaxID=2479841 RepID=UPI00111A769B|nr:molybdopterin-dependent oxidoreductase [Raoultibacter phocaeensis]
MDDVRETGRGVTEDWICGKDGSSASVAATGKDLPWRWQEGELTVTRTCAWSAPGCHLGCGVKVYTDDDGRFVKLEGDEENPFNQGRLCVRCLSFDQVIDHPDRLRYPMKRARENRGVDAWERITWEEAYDLICTKFAEIKERFGPEAVIFASGTGRDIANGMYRMCYSFGSPNIAYLQTGVACYGPRISATSIMMGNYCVPDCSMYFADRYKNPDWDVPGVLFIWGNNPLISNADGNFGHWMIDCMKRGSKLVVVDPRLTWLAAKADLFLRLRPGTDAALALAIINIIIEEQAYDHEFVENWTYGFEDLAAAAAEYPVAKASEITWVPEAKIREAARMATDIKPMTIQWGLALDQTREAIPGSMALVALWALTGSIDVPGGMVTTHQPFGAEIWQPPAAETFLDEAVVRKRIGYDEYPLYKYSGCVVSQPDITLDACITGEPYPIKAAWLQSTNPLSCCSQQPESKVLKALTNLEFNVVVDIFMTPTAMACAEVVLPVATFAEKTGMRSIWYYLQPINAAVDSSDIDVKSDLQINFELGKRWNPEKWPWDSLEEFFSEQMGSSGISYDDLREINWMYPRFEYRKYRTGKQRSDGQPGFNTPTGRVEFKSTLLDGWGFESVPSYHETDYGPLSTPELMKEYPLILTTGARHWSYFHSEGRQIPRLRALRPDPIVEIHPDTAERYGIHEGDWVNVENMLGSIRMKAELTIAVPPSVVNVDHAWWFPESDPEDLYLTFASNANQLVPTDFGSTGFGANCKSLICKISRES